MDEGNNDLYSFDIAVIPNELQTPKLLSWSRGTWIGSSGVSEVSTGLKLWWVGDRLLFTTEGAEAVDPELLQQLQTLGYIR